MEDFTEKIQEALQGIRKNVSDLIGQEMTLLVFAQLIRDHPELESKLDVLFHKIYLNTSRTLEMFMFELLENQAVSLKEGEVLLIKQNIQIFVHELVEEKKENVIENYHWLDRNIS